MAVVNVIQDLEQLRTIEYSRKVKIPKFIANTMGLYGSLQEMLTEEYYSRSTEEIDDDNVFCWIDDNFNALCDACLNGYEVEEEPKYWAVKTATDYLRAGNDILAISDKSRAQETAYLIGYEAVIEPVGTNLKGYLYVTKEYEVAE